MSRIRRKKKLVSVLINGDATKRSVLRKNVSDLIITSPPYNLGKAYSGDKEDDEIPHEDYLEFTRTWLQNCFYWSKTTGRLCVNVPLDNNYLGKRPATSQLTYIAMQVGWHYHATIIWNKGHINKRSAWGSWKSASAPNIIAPVETIIVFYKDEWKRKRQGISDISGEEFKTTVNGLWTFTGESSKRIGHEAPFPRVLPRRCIKLLSFPGDTILDPFNGSGTTMIEATLHGRKSIGVELERKYCKLFIRRANKICGVEFKKTSMPKLVRNGVMCWKADKIPFQNKLL